MRKFHVISIVIILVAIVGWLVISKIGQDSSISSNGSTSMPIEQESQLAKAPNFSLQDYNGKTVSLADFTTQPLVVNSWATWCPFCRKELVDFAAAQKEFGDKVVIISVNRQESLATAKSFTDEQGTSNNLTFLLDPSDSFYRSIGGFSMPETIFVDKNGNIVDHKRGPMDLDEIRQKIEKIL